MSPLEVDNLLAPVSEDGPAGPNLESDAQFIELERAAQGRPETQWDEGEDADWADVHKRCTDLLAQTKHLRLAVLLTVAALEREGLSGARDGLKLLHGLVERYWDDVHPQLDPDDDNDPIERINILLALTAPPGTMGDPLQFQKRLREVPLCESRRLGRFSLRDVLAARGETAPADPDQPPPEMSMIEGAFADSDPDLIQAQHQVVTESIELVQQLEQTLTERVGHEQAPSFDNVVSLFKQLNHAIQQHAGGTVASPEANGVQDAASDGGAAPAEADGAGGQPAAPAAPGEIRSRDEILLTLDKICDYYRRHEPSSPVPLLLKRARSLVNKDFVEIVEDLTPEALEQVRSLGGLSQDEQRDD